MSNPHLHIVCASEEAGVAVVQSERNQTFITGHLEYDAATLAYEYENGRRTVNGLFTRFEGKTFEPQRLFAGKTVGIADAQLLAGSRRNRCDDAVGGATADPVPIEPLVRLMFVENECQAMFHAQQPPLRRECLDVGRTVIDEFVGRECALRAESPCCSKPNFTDAADGFSRQGRCLSVVVHGGCIGKGPACSRTPASDR